MTRIKNLGLLFVGVACLSFLAKESRAVQVVNYDGTANYVSANNSFARVSLGTFVAESSVGGGTDVNGDGDQADNVIFASLSTSTPFNPASGYTGPGFYGGVVSTEVATSPEFNTLQIRDNTAGGGDYLFFLGRRATVATPVLFELSEQTTVANAINFSVDGTSTLAADGINNFSASARFLVRNDGTYYVSNATINGSGNNVEATSTTTSINLASELFSIYNVAEGDTALDLISPSYTISGSTFSNVEAVGFLFLSTGGGSGNKFGIAGFRVDLFVTEASPAVPEPTTFSLLASACLGTVTVVRRKNRAQR